MVLIDFRGSWTWAERHFVGDQVGNWIQRLAVLRARAFNWRCVASNLLTWKRPSNLGLAILSVAPVTKAGSCRSTPA
jgi:hypothetical protein